MSNLDMDQAAFNYSLTVALKDMGVSLFVFMLPTHRTCGKDMIASLHVYHP